MIKESFDVRITDLVYPSRCDDLSQPTERLVTATAWTETIRGVAKVDFVVRSRTIAIARCTILSSTQAIPSGRVLSSPFGISRRKLGWVARSCIALRCSGWWSVRIVDRKRLCRVTETITGIAKVIIYFENGSRDLPFIE